MREAISVFRGWKYLLLFVTGGAFVRRAQLGFEGANVKISPTVFFKYPWNIRIGDNTFVNHLCNIWASEEGSITIGADVLFGPGVTVVSHNHGTTPGELIRRQRGHSADVVISNDVWIGAHAVITPGVTIGEGCVVGAGAVVTRDLPAYAICAGVPARVVRYRDGSPLLQEAPLTSGVVSRQR